MIVYLVRRLINYAILSMLATVLAYVMACLALDPKARYLGRNPRPSDDAINHILNRLGTNPNDPILSRTMHWFTQIIFHGNFGLEYNYNSVSHDMFVRSGTSLQLLLLGSILGALFGVVLGVWGSVRQYKASDQVVT